MLCLVVDENQLVMGKLPELLRGLVSVLTYPDAGAVRGAVVCLTNLSINGTYLSPFRYFDKSCFVRIASVSKSFLVFACLCALVNTVYCCR